MSEPNVNRLTIVIDPNDWAQLKQGLIDKPTMSVQFNPQTFDYTWKVNWSNKDTEGKALNTLQFQNVDKRNLTLSLIFDAREAKVASVKDLTRKFELLAKPIVGRPNDPTQRPPIITVSWGRTVEGIRGVLSSFGQQFTLFSKDGVPLRARVTMAIEEYVGAEKELKEFRSGDPEQYLTVAAGDTLPNIAFRQFGDSSLWRVIASDNNLDDARALEPGSRIFIRALETLKR